MKITKESIAYNRIWEKIRLQPLVYDTITTTCFSMIGKGVSFLVPFFVATLFGVTAETDAFFFSYGLILFLAGIFAPVVENVIVPYIAEARGNNEDVGRFVGTILGISGIALLILTAIFLFTIEPVLSIVTHFNAESLHLITMLLIETAPFIILLSWSSLLAGTINAYQRFSIPAISPVFRTTITLVIIFTLKDILGIHAIAWGYTIGEAFRLMILFGLIDRFKLYSVSFSITLNDKLKEFLKTISFQIAGMTIVGLNPIVDKAMASWLGHGAVSILYYADRLYMIPVTFIATGLMITILSHWSDRYYASGSQHLDSDVTRIVKPTIIAALTIMFLLILLHQPIVKFAFGRGAFDEANLSEVGWAWFCYLLGFAPYVISQILNRRLLVLKRTKLLFSLSLLWVSMNIIFNTVLMHFLQVAGIALATTVVYTLASIILFGLFIRETKASDAKRAFK
jgi:putative peptidoglycan lipid II flippase